MKSNTAISEKQLKTLFKEGVNSNSIPFAEIKQRLAMLTSLLDEFESSPSSGTYLLIAKNGTGKLWFPMNKDIINIGRSQKADLTLDDNNISRFHCRIEKEDEIWEISDLDSKNGIKINGKIYKQRSLCNGDIIKIGAFDLYFVIT